MSQVRRFSPRHVRRLLGSRAVEQPLFVTSRRGYADIPNNPVPKANTIVNQCHEGQIVAVERFGKYYTQKKPGLFFSFPIIDTLWTIDMRETVINITPQGAITRDNVRIEICGSLYVRFVDPWKALYGARRPLFAAVQQAQSVMRSCVGKMEMDDIFHQRSDLNAAVQDGIQNATTSWGLEVNRYEVTDIIPDPEIAKAMDLQAAAERHRREKVKGATAEKEATILISEAQRTRDTNESEGTRIRMINEAEGQAAKIIKEAEAKATAVESVAKALANSPEGAKALEFELACKYFEYMQTLGKSPSTVFLNSNVGDVSGMVAQAVATLRVLDNNKDFAKNDGKHIEAERPAGDRNIEAKNKPYTSYKPNKDVNKLP